VLTAEMRSNAGTMRSSIIVKSSNLVQVRSISMRIRSIALAHYARKQLLTKQAQAHDCAVNGANALDHNRGAIERSYRVYDSNNLNKRPKQPNKPILIFFWILSIQKHKTNKIIAEFKITSRKIKLI
jgi:hypothetical protein